MNAHQSNAVDAQYDIYYTNIYSLCLHFSDKSLNNPQTIELMFVL